MYGYIYKTTNLLNNKIYIGKHKGSFTEKYLGSGKYLLNAINKYGKDKFIVELVEYCKTLEIQNEREIYWIAYYKKRGASMYNIANGGEGGDLVTCLPKNDYKCFCQLMSELNKKGITGNKGKHLSETHKKRIGQSNKGKVRSEEVKYRHSACMKGKIPWNKGLTKDDPRVAKNIHKKGEFHHSEETKKRISEKTKGIKKPRVSENSKGRKWMHKGDVTVMIRPEEIDKYKQLGFIEGRGKIK